MNNPRVSTCDFIELDYTADLTEAGIAYVRKYLLSKSHLQTGSAAYEAFQQAVAEVAVELAFRRFLIRQKIPHRTLEATPFTTRPFSTPS